MSNPIQQAIEAIEQARTELEQYEEDATGEHYNSPRLNAALSALQSLQGVELPPLLPSDHPAPHTLAWTKVEIEAIQDYARTAVAAAMARGAVPQPDEYWIVRKSDTEVFQHPAYGPGIFFTEDASLSAAPTPEATQPDPLEKLTRLQEDMGLYDDATQPTQAEAPSEREALSVIAAFPITDEKNMDAVNMRDVARRAVVRAALATQQAGQGEAVVWRCFHCDEVFLTKADAELHFGRSEYDKPACQFNVEHIRWMEAQHRRNVDDDSEALRTVRSLLNEHEDLRRKAEELGYARGLADAKKHPEDLGLVSTPPAPQQPEALAQQEREPLTDEQRKQITAMWSRENRNYTVADIIDAVEAAYGIRAARSSEGGQP